MNRYLATLLLLSLPSIASAESVSFGAKLDNDGGHAGGSASATNVAVETGRMSWSGTAVTFDSGWIIGGLAVLDGTITRSGNPGWEGQRVRVIANAAEDSVQVTITDLGLSFAGFGHVTIR